MPKKLQTAKTLLNVYGGFLLAIAIIAFGALTLLGAFGGLYDDPSSRISGLEGALVGGSIGLVIFIGVGAMGVFYLVVARALKNKKNWAKIAAIVLAILMLGSFPIGTIFGVFVLVGIFDNETDAWFGEKVVTQSTGHDHKA